MTGENPSNPGHVESRWLELCAAIFDGEESALQVKEMRRAFYAGVTAANDIYIRMADDSLPEAEVEAAILSICEELLAFGEAVKAGRA